MQELWEERLNARAMRREAECKSYEKRDWMQELWEERLNARAMRRETECKSYEKCYWMQELWEERLNALAMRRETECKSYEKREFHVLLLKFCGWFTCAGFFLLWHFCFKALRSVCLISRYASINEPCHILGFYLPSVNCRVRQYCR